MTLGVPVHLLGRDSAKQATATCGSPATRHMFTCRMDHVTCNGCLSDVCDAAWDHAQAWLVSAVNNQPLHGN